jgi:peptide-methionine (S)-S-oxide reductase
MIGSVARAVVIGAAAIGGTVTVSRMESTSKLEQAPILPAPNSSAALTPIKGKETAVFAGGCFWGIDAVFKHVKGVLDVTSGYAGGNVVNPSYEEVSTGTTGNAESVRVNFDPSQVSYSQLLQVFFSSFDPTELNRQGPDVGTQYRSAIFYMTDEQKKLADAYVKQLTDAKAFKRPIVTEVTKLNNFSPAEAYHQNYFALHPNQPYIVINDAPKVEHLRKAFPALYKN